MNDPVSTLMGWVLAVAFFCVGYGLGKDSVYHDCQNVGVFYTASKVYECKERK